MARLRSLAAFDLSGAYYWSGDMVATGKSNVEIARKLIVAPSTIKWYLKHLYAKLQVHSRVQALARSRHLRLLE